MGRRLKRVRKRFIEISRAAGRVFEMCRCRMRRVDGEDDEDISVDKDVSVDKGNSVSSAWRAGIQSSRPTSKTASRSQSVTSVKSSFSWHCLKRPTDELSTIKEPGREHSYSPHVHYAESSEWAAILPGDETFQKAFTNGAMAEVALVSHGEKTFVRKQITDHKGEYEASITIDSQCEFVVHLYSCFAHSNSIFLHLQYYNMKDLSYWMTKDADRQVFTNEMSIWITLHILTGIRAIHSKGIFHMDIKPQNILISDEGYPLLTDFGGAIRLSDPLSLHCATDAYLCPELANDDKQQIRTGLADLWAATIIYCELATSVRPVDIDSVQTCCYYTAARLGFYVGNLSEASSDFLCSALEMEPTDRLGYHGGVKELLMHEMFAEANWMSLVDRFHNIKSPLLEKLIGLDAEHQD